VVVAGDMRFVSYQAYALEKMVVACAIKNKDVWQEIPKG